MLTAHTMHNCALCSWAPHFMLLRAVLSITIIKICLVLSYSTSTEGLVLCLVIPEAHRTLKCFWLITEHIIANFVYELILLQKLVLKTHKNFEKKANLSIIQTFMDRYHFKSHIFVVLFCWNFSEGDETEMVLNPIELIHFMGLPESLIYFLEHLLMWKGS